MCKSVQLHGRFGVCSVPHSAASLGRAPGQHRTLDWRGRRTVNPMTRACAVAWVSAYVANAAAGAIHTARTGGAQPIPLWGGGVASAPGDEARRIIELVRKGGGAWFPEDGG